MSNNDHYIPFSKYFLNKQFYHTYDWIKQLKNNYDTEGDDCETQTRIGYMFAVKMIGLFREIQFDKIQVSHFIICDIDKVIEFSADFFTSLKNLTEHQIHEFCKLLEKQNSNDETLLSDNAFMDDCSKFANLIQSFDDQNCSTRIETPDNESKNLESSSDEVHHDCIPLKNNKNCSSLSSCKTASAENNNSTDSYSDILRKYHLAKMELNNLTVI